MISRFNTITNSNKLVIKSNRNKKHHTNNNTNPNFKGPVSAATGLLNFLNVNPAIGACFVDFGFMVTPRTIVDAGRSKDAGIETGIRESSGTFNHGIAGGVGLGAGYLVSRTFNDKHGVQAHWMFMDSDAIDTFKNFVKTSETEAGYDAKTYWNSFFKSLRGLNSSQGNQAWHKIPDEVIEKATDLMVNSGTNKYRVAKETNAEISRLITGETGSSSTFKIVQNLENGTEISSKTSGSLEELLGNANSMLKAVRDKSQKDGTAIVTDLERFLKGVKNRKLATVVAGLSVPVAIGISAQPINRYLTKKRTGDDSFVGVKGRQPDHSTGFKVLKAIAAIGIGSGMISTILKHPMDLYTKFGSASKEILSKLQYKGIVPTINQFKFIYGVTIMSRFFSSRDKNELRESCIKDTLGFANWLILGSFVSKGVAMLFNKDLLNYDKKAYGESKWKPIFKGIEKTHEEILYPTLKKLGISVFDDKGKVIKFRKLINLMSEKAKSPEVSSELKQLIASTKTRLILKNLAQVSGYVYSGLVLGFGIPKLNIAITKYFDKKQAEKEQIAEKENMENFIKSKNADYYPKSHPNAVFAEFSTYFK